MRHKIVIHNGTVKAIYDDALLPVVKVLEQHGGVQMERAAHVEPTTPSQHKHGSRWKVDLTPSGGLVHYSDEQGRPFETRQVALDFEHRWLEQHFLGVEPKEGDAPC